MHRLAGSLLLLAVATARAETGKLILHFLQLPVGVETYELTGNVLRSHFEYTERGSTVTLDATLRMKADLTPCDASCGLTVPDGYNALVDLTVLIATSGRSSPPPLLRDRIFMNRSRPAVVHVVAVRNRHEP